MGILYASPLTFFIKLTFRPSLTCLPSSSPVFRVSHCTLRKKLLKMPSSLHTSFPGGSLGWTIHLKVSNICSISPSSGTNRWLKVVCRSCNLTSRRQSYHWLISSRSKPSWRKLSSLLDHIAHAEAEEAWVDEQIAGWEDIVFNSVTLDLVRLHEKHL